MSDADRSSGPPKQTPTSNSTRPMRAPGNPPRSTPYRGTNRPGRGPSATTTNEPPRGRAAPPRSPARRPRPPKRPGTLSRCAATTRGTGEPARRERAAARRDHLAERPTSRPFSTDESVVSLRRCRRGATRSFHGLWSPPRSLDARSEPTLPRRVRDPSPGSPPRPKPRGARGVCPGARWVPSGPRRSAGRLNRPSWGFRRQ